jgi:hypothetical protein
MVNKIYNNTKKPNTEIKSTGCFGSEFNIQNGDVMEVCYLQIFNQRITVCI